MEKLLMLSTNYVSCEMIKYAKSQGVYTIVTDYYEPQKSPAKLIADEYWMISTSNVDELEKKCRKEGITAVCCGLSEFNLEIQMELCRRLGLNSYLTPQAWRYSRDKAAFKALCKEVGAPVAEDYYISDKLTDDELNKVVFPVVVKPVDQSGNRGVSYCYNKEQLIDAYKFAKSISMSDTIIVERMLHGEEWYSSYAVANGKVSLLALNAMYSQPGEPKNCYSVTTTVSDHVEQFIKEINPAIEKVFQKVGCTDGYVWMQVMLDEDGRFYIIEMGYRLDGGLVFYPYRQLCNFDTVKWMVDAARGIKHSSSQLPKPQTKAYEECACGMELWVNKGGVIKEMIGFEELSSIHGFGYETLRRVGDSVDKYRSVGVITFCANDCDELCKKIQIVNETIRVINEDGEDMIIKYTDFDYLKRIYLKGLAGN